MNGLGARLMAWMESASVNRADIIYAPSQYSADYYRNYRKRYVHVLRPPSYLELDHIKTNTGDLPARYMIHFGSIGPVKGSDWLAEALPIVWSVAPDFSMIWAGPERVPGAMRQYRELWGKHADKVIWLGAVEKSQLYGLLRLAEAAVLPSRVDNLPNSVIESLQLEVPVIGSKGASIDELIEDGQSGTLVPIGDVTALAEAIVVAWKGEAAWSAKGFQPPAVLEEFIPENAVKNLIALATKT
jgi:glycosyltransferase involved in cell wall biosynthesis